jgi:hypothetical protein
MQITTVGIDLAKNVFQVHGVDNRGGVVLRKKLKRGHVAVFFANLPRCVVGMEACASAHHWARKLVDLGHDVRLIAPQFVKPYVKNNKTDAADAEAICEAVSRPSMRFVPIKTVEQQSVLALHRARQGFVKARTAQANQIRGLLGEYGVIVPQGIAHVGERVPRLIEEGVSELPEVFCRLVKRLLEHLRELQRQVDEIDARGRRVVAHGGRHEALRHHASELRRAHQPRDPLAADLDVVRVGQLSVDVRGAVDASRPTMDLVDLRGKRDVLSSTLRQRTIVPRIEAALRHPEHSAHRGHVVMGLVRLHESEERFGVATFSLANQAAAFERISRSSRRRRFSRRSRVNSSRSALVRPPSPAPASRSACLTHVLIDHVVQPNSFESSRSDRPVR